MDMNFLRLALNYFLLNLKTNDKSDILSKAKDKDERSFLIRITPYIIVLMLFVLVVLVLWVMIAHGANLTGTEANTWQRMEGII